MLAHSVLIFTDGACEDRTTIGGVIFIPGGGARCFGAVVPVEITELWKTRDGQEQVIGQAELFPLLVGRLTWVEALQGKRVLYFIDNESARLAMVKAYSPVLPPLEIVVDCLAWDSEHEASSWHARVPSPSNIADDPSRMCAALVKKLYRAKGDKPIFPGGVQPVVFLE